MRSIRLSLAAGPRAPAEARTGLSPLAGEIPPATFEMLRLLVSELVTNSVRHARLGEAGRVVLSVRTSSGGLRAEVVDSGCGFDPLLSPLSRDQEYGWGLHLVDRIADRWGVDRGDQTTVWFEINW